MAIKALTMTVALLMIILPIVCAMFWGCKMDIAAIEELVTSLGFPIACVIALGFFAFYVVDKSSKQNKTNMLLGEIPLTKFYNSKDNSIELNYIKLKGEIYNDKVKNRR